MTEFRPKYGSLAADEITGAFRSDIYDALYKRYGADPDAVVSKRVQDEWDALMRSGTVLDAAALYELTLWLRETQSPYLLCEGAGASFLFFLLGMSLGNPLPPHSYCPKCHRVDWESYIFRDGFDLPDLSCESDGSPRIRDGHDISYRMLWGYGEFNGYHIRVVDSLLDPLLQILDQHWLRKSDARLAQKEQVPNIIYFSNITISCLLDPSTIRPSFYDIKITADDAYYALKEAESLINDVSSEKPLNIPHPMDFSDLLSSFGLAHSKGAWDNNAQSMLCVCNYTASDLICFRDDVFQYLLEHGFSAEDAWKGMQESCKGHGFPIVTDEMQKARDKWVIYRCEKILHLFHKAHALEYIFFMLKATLVLPQLRIDTNG